VSVRECERERVRDGETKTNRERGRVSVKETSKSPEFIKAAQAHTLADSG
jgi:hypothetical protein